jgi:hypothetical protein
MPPWRAIQQETRNGENPARNLHTLNLYLPNMKNTLIALGGAMLLVSCADVRVVDTQTAAVVTERPKAIYIRPFSVEGAQFVEHHAGGPGELELKKSLAPATFSEDLKEELEKLAPAHVLASDEVATQGWLVTGSIELVDGGTSAVRLFSPPLPPGAGRSHIRIHVRVKDLDHRAMIADSKESSTLVRRGRIIYEFDVAGGSHESGHYGTITAPGAGYSAPFDYRNSAERIRIALEADPHKYGEHPGWTMQ